MCVIGLKDKSNFLELYLYPAIRQNLVEPIYPENPKHPRQKYRLTDKGKELVTQIQDLKKLLVAYRTGLIKEKV